MKDIKNIRHILFVALFTGLIQAKIKLSDYGYNIYSQYGEDGIIEKIFEIIGTESKVSIEFGAWDGFYLSNTAVLWSKKNWKGILIESNIARYKELKKKVEQHNCIAINAQIGKDPHDCLEAVLKNNNIDALEIDLLSIDIDSDDYYVFESLTIKPRVIICEYNPTFPIQFDIYPPYGNYCGCSAKALIRVAESKGYKLIAITDSNCFFIRQEYFSQFSSFETNPKLIAIDKYLKFIVTDYSGKHLVIGEREATPYGMNGAYQGQLNGDFKTTKYRISK